MHKKKKQTKSIDDLIEYQNNRCDYKQYINYLKKQSNELPNTMKLNGKNVNAQTEIAELFCIFSESTYSQHDSNVIHEFNQSTITKKLANIYQNIPSK